MATSRVGSFINVDGGMGRSEPRSGITAGSDGVPPLPELSTGASLAVQPNIVANIKYNSRFFIRHLLFA
jgi:hypothetical protein